MNWKDCPYVESVRPLDDYRLEVLFENGECRIFDVKPYMTHGVFARLRDRWLFKAARVVSGSIEWPGELDLSYETLYVKSEPVSIVPTTPEIGSPPGAPRQGKDIKTED